MVAQIAPAEARSSHGLAASAAGTTPTDCGLARGCPSPKMILSRIDPEWAGPKSRDSGLVRAVRCAIWGDCGLALQRGRREKLDPGQAQIARRPVWTRVGLARIRKQRIFRLSDVAQIGCPGVSAGSGLAGSEAGALPDESGLANSALAGIEIGDVDGGLVLVGDGIGLYELRFELEVAFVRAAELAADPRAGD